MTHVLAVLLFLLPALATAQTEGVLVDRVVATVGDTPITASEVALEGSLRERIATIDRPERDLFGRLLTEAREPLEAVIFRAILMETAEFASVRITDDREAYERFAAFEETFEDRKAAAAFRKSWGLSRVQLVEYFRVSAVLDHTVEIAVDRGVRVTEEDERRYYDDHQEQLFAEQEFSDVRASIARQVYELTFDKAYQSWRKRLQAGTRLRYLR
jgi:hypothetical protein